MTTQQIQLPGQVQQTFKDARCPVFFADSQQVVTWCSDGVVRVQYRALHLTDPLTGAAEVSPVVEVATPLPVFFAVLDGMIAQAQALEKQGIKRVPLAAVAPTTPGGAAH